MNKAHASRRGVGGPPEDAEALDTTQEAARTDASPTHDAPPEQTALARALLETTLLQGADPQDDPFVGQVPRAQMVEHLTRLQREYQQLRAMLDRMRAQVSQREAHVRQRLRDLLAMADPVEPVSHQNRPPQAAQDAPAPVLYVQALGQFAVRYRDRALSLGSNKNGRAIFRYLVTRSEHQSPKDVLLALFWPEEGPETAGHKLHIAISELRKALDGVAEGSVLFVDDRYLLSPELHVELDTEAFAWHAGEGERLEEAGRIAEAIAAYEAAHALYRGEYMAQDLYADWTVPQRARYEEMHLTLLGRLAHHYSDRHRYEDSIACCREILARDSFREDAYRQLMRCYSRLGRRNQALCEYEACREVLRWELGVDPMRETTALYERIVREEPV